MRYILLLLLALSILFSCKKESATGNKNSPNLHITLALESDQYFPAPETRRLTGFMFSPIEEKNKIWVSGIPAYELDVITGKYTLLQEKFNLDFKADFRNEKAVTPDPYSDNVFISFRNQGILQLNKQTGAHHFYKSKAPFAHVFPTKEFVVLANNDGIHSIERGSNRLKKMVSIPSNIRAHKFDLKGNDSLLINNGNNVFNLKTLAFTSGKEDRTLSYDTAQPIRSLQDVLKIKGGGRARVILTDTIEWYLNNQFLHYSLDGQKLYEYENIQSREDPRNLLRHLRSDDKYVYLLFNKGVGIYNKQHIFKSGVLFNSYQQQHELDLWHSGMEMFADKDVRLPDLIHKIDSLQELEIKSSKLRYNISVLHTKLQEPFKVREAIQLQCEEAIKNNALPEKYFYPACYGLMTVYARKNQIAKAVSFYEMMKPLDLNITDEVMERRFVPVLLSVHKELDSLNTIAISEDEKLFKEAKAKGKLVSILTIFNESYPDYSEIDKMYKSIVRNNPSSDYADNAAFEIIEHKHLYKDIGDIEPLQDWQKWIDAYPHSELRARAIVKLARYTNSNFHEGENPQMKDLEKVQSLLSSIHPIDLKGHKQDSTFYTSLLQEIEASMFKAHINVEILPKELIFKLDQPIVFTVRFKNKSDKDFNIDLFAKGSELAIQLYNRGGQIPSDYGNRLMDQTRTVTIPVGGYRDCTISLSENSKIFKNTGWVEGRYNVKEAGIYFISFYNPNDMIGPQTKFEVVE